MEFWKVPVTWLRTFLLVIAGVLLVSVSSLLFAAQDHVKVARNIYYGSGKDTDNALQSLDIYWLDNHKLNPVIIYVHGGGWAFGDKSNVNDKPTFFNDHKIAFISMNYRLRWEYTLYDQLEDVVSVVRWVKQHHRQYSLDPKKIVLMGEGAGAFLVSLVGTDEDMLKTSGLDLSDIRIVVSIENPSYDIVTLMKDSGDFLEKRRYRLIFGTEKKVWSAFSPINHISAGKGIPPFALLYVTDNVSETNQAKSFAKALRDAKVDVIMIPDNKKKASESVNEELGTPGDGPTLALMAFIRAAI